MKRFSFFVAIAAAIALAGASYATRALADEPMLTKAAPITYAPPSPAACGSAYDFFFTACPLSWYGVTFFGTVDVGASYETHGVPFDPNHPTGNLYVVGAGGTNATNRNAMFGLAPNAMSQSSAGFKVNEAIASGWSFVAQGELAFDPYSGLLANAPRAEFNSIGVPENQQLVPYDSSRWGWLAAQNYVGVSSTNLGTLTFGRLNVLTQDGIISYDPMGASYAFSLIGYSGKTAGGGDTENARWTTAIKYRVNIGDFRLGAMLQPIGLFGGGGGFAAYNANDGAAELGIGGDIKHVVPGVISWDLIGDYERSAANWGTFFAGNTMSNGWPTNFLGPLTPSGIGFHGAGLKMTLSDNLAGMALLKWSFGSWGDPAPVVGKAPVAPSGIPLTFYAGYEVIRFSNPSDPQTGSLADDGFNFNFVNTTANLLSANGTTIANNAFNSNCKNGYTCTDEIFQVIWVGAKYGITRNLDIIGAYYHYIQNQYINVPTPVPGDGSCANQANLSQCGGWFDMYSAVLDWRFLPKWDTYIGILYSAEFGGLANGRYCA